MTSVVLFGMPFNKPLTKIVAIGASTAEESATNRKLSVDKLNDLGRVNQVALG